MKRYVIAEDRAIWVREFYAVEVDETTLEEDQTPEDAARESHCEGGCDFLGFTLEDSVDMLDTHEHSLQETDDFPFLMHPSRDHPDTILIVVEGGVIQNIEGIPAGVQVEVRDYDVEGCEPGDDLKTNDVGDEYFESIWQAFTRTPA